MQEKQRQKEEPKKKELEYRLNDETTRKEA